VKLILILSGNEPAFFRFGSCFPFPALRLVPARFPRLLFCFTALAYELLMKSQIPDKMEAAAAGISAHRSSTGGTNTTASSDSQNATSSASKTSTTGSETGQTSTAAASTTTTGTAAVSSQASGMLSRLYRQQVNDSGEPFSHPFHLRDEGLVLSPSLLACHLSLKSFASAAVLIREIRRLITG